ncbi:hypothetical protein LSTR_LSTR004571 [Laodelphax striatellus]|uniref:Uncharacterized protein n=1 Tax=Laodelphax striatellus TaxID=195883 RepID=A0A482WTQ1_LAOST|nr:hypothetical protein LSTR_LSTR004571 [Laodelphax striatellus]
MIKYLKTRFKRSCKQKNIQENLEMKNHENSDAKNKDSSELEKPKQQHSANKESDEHSNSQNINSPSSEFEEPEQADITQTQAVCEVKGESGDLCEVENKSSIDSSGLEDSLVNRGSSEIRNIYLQLLHSGYFNRITPSGLGWNVDTTFMSCDKVQDRNDSFDSTNAQVRGDNTIQEPISFENTVTEPSVSNQRSDINHDKKGKLDNNIASFLYKKNSFTLLPQISEIDKAEAISVNNEHIDDQISKIEREAISDDNNNNNSPGTLNLFNHSGKIENYEDGTEIINNKDERIQTLNSILNQLLENLRLLSPPVSNQNTTDEKYYYDIINYNDNNDKDINKIYEKGFLDCQVEEFEPLLQKQNYQVSKSTSDLGYDYDLNSNVQLNNQSLLNNNGENTSNLFQQRFLKNLRRTDIGDISEEACRAAMITGLGFSRCLQNIVQENDEIRKLLKNRYFSKSENNAQKYYHIMTFSLSDLNNGKSELEFFEMSIISEEETQTRLRDPSRKISEFIELSPRKPENEQETIVYCLTNFSQKEMIIRKKTNDTDWSNWLLEMNLDAVVEKTVITDINNMKNILTLKIGISSSKIVLTL